MYASAGPRRGKPMARLVRQWEEPRSRFGDLVVIGFVLMQCLDAVFTYLGVTIWGPAIEANPLISSAMAAGGVIGAWPSASACSCISVACIALWPFSPPSTLPWRSSPGRLCSSSRVLNQARTARREPQFLVLY